MTAVWPSFVGTPRGDEARCAWEVEPGLRLEERRALIVLAGGIPSVDDTVLGKPRSQEGKTGLVGCFWSGLHGKAAKGINLVTLFYGEAGGRRASVNFRVVDKPGGKTKSEGEDVDLPASGRALYLRHFGWVGVFRTFDQNNGLHLFPRCGRHHAGDSLHLGLFNGGSLPP